MNVINLFVFITIAVSLVCTSTAASQDAIPAGSHCESDDECSPSMMCDFSGCLDPCEEYPDENADCTVEDHEPRYTCHDGYGQLPGSDICLPAGEFSGFLF